MLEMGDERAVRLFCAAARGEHGAVMCREEGRGVPRDWAEAERWFAAAAMNCVAEARVSLLRMIRERSE